jgi:hypothetical protein
MGIVVRLDRAHITYTQTARDANVWFASMLEGVAVVALRARTTPSLPADDRSQT